MFSPNRSDPSDPEDALDPAQERVLRKLRTFAVFSGVVMGAGFLAVFGAIGYRLAVGWKSTPPRFEGTIRLPQGARVLSAVPGQGVIAVTLDRAGAVETRFFDAATLAPRGTVTYAVEP